MTWMRHSYLCLLFRAPSFRPGRLGAGQTELIDFSASWCGPCRQMEPIVAQLAAQGYPVRKVDIDQDRALAAKYRVQTIPCFVMLVNGQEVQRVGPTSAEKLKQMLDAAGAGPRREPVNMRETAAKSRGRSRAQARAQSPDNVGLAPPQVSFPSQQSESPLVGAAAVVPLAGSNRPCSSQPRRNFHNHPERLRPEPPLSRQPRRRRLPFQPPTAPLRSALVNARRPRMQVRSPRRTTRRRRPPRNRR